MMKRWKKGRKENEIGHMNGWLERSTWWKWGRPVSDGKQRWMIPTPLSLLCFCLHRFVLAWISVAVGQALPLSLAMNSAHIACGLFAADWC